MGFSIGGFNPFNINTYTKPAKQVAKVIVGGVEKVADDFLGIDDSGGIVGSVSKIGEKVEDGLREAVDEVDKVLENPYVRLAISIAYPPAAPYLNAYAKLDSGEKLNAADIAAIAATAGQDFGAFEAANIDPEIVDNIKKGVQVATADDPAKALLLTYGTDVAEQTGITEAFDTQVADTFGQDVLDVIKQNKDYVVDTARLATGEISEEELVAKYGAGALDYATAGTGFEEYSSELNSAIQVATGNQTIEEALANQYGEEIVTYLGAETPNERAVGLGGLTTATQLAMGVDPAEAAYAGTKRAYDEGARLKDLTWVGNQVAGIDLGINDVVSNLGIDFPDLKVQGYELPELADLGINLGNLNITAPDILETNLSLPEIADLGVDFGKADFSGYSTADLGDYNLKELGDLGIDVNKLDLMPEFQMIGLAQLLEPTTPVGVDLKDDEELASLQSEFDIAPTDDTLFSREVLARTGKLA